MIGGDLFHRFFLRFLVALAISFLLLLMLFHLFQSKTVDKEWQVDLQQEAFWLARHMSSLSQIEPLLGAWNATHSKVRLTFVDADWNPVGESREDLAWLDLETLREGGTLRGYLIAVEPVIEGHTLIMSRPWVPSFPYDFHWELVGAALLIVALAVVFVYPLVRSLSSVFRRMTGMAGEVASGHFGKTLGIERKDELGDLVRAFDDMSRKLAEAERLNTRLLHDVSHELRSPLTRIRVMAETLAHRPEETKECLAGIEQEVGLLDRLVGDLVQTARIESEPRASRPEPFALLAWSEELLGRLGQRVCADGITWTTSLPDGTRRSREIPNVWPRR